MHKNWFAIVVMTLIVVAAGTACQPKVADASEAVDITVVTSEFKFNPDMLIVRVGQRVRVTLDNTKGTLKHDMHQPELNIHAEVEAGKKGIFEFTPTKTGTFDLVCDVPGHKDAGMVGKLIVQP
jgi:uncharacterized cupredoxin-like copper-binding protein